MKTAPFQRLISLLLILSMAFTLALGCAGCSGTADGAGSASAASMFLRKTEGTVAVADAEGVDVAPAENLGLYSGYTVGTEAESYAWIDLDKVKLTKLDESSAAEITKDGKNLSIEVTAGSLFFNVTEPLAEDETMEIRTSSMLVGIRGTCGWVEVPDSSTMRVYLLEGKVECIAGQNNAMVNAGEMAEMAADGSIEVSAFTVWNVPAFVAEEMKADEALSEAVLAVSGIDVAGDLLSGYPGISFWLDGKEIVFAEEIDFETDGSPELLVICKYDERTDENTTYPGGYESYRFRSGTEKCQFLGNSGISVSDHSGGKISLVEFGGKLFVCEYYRYDSADGSQGDSYSYFGSITENDGGRDDWGRVDGVSCHRLNNPFSYSMASQSENGLRNGAYYSCTAEEYEAVIAKYTEVRVLVEG